MQYIILVVVIASPLAPDCVCGPLLPHWTDRGGIAVSAYSAQIRIPVGNAYFSRVMHLNYDEYITSFIVFD